MQCSGKICASGLAFAFSVSFRSTELQPPKKRPLVIPVLFYHSSRSPYPYTTNWLDCFRNPEQAGKVYTKGFLLVDITFIDDDITHHRLMAVLTLLMKHIRQRDMMELLDRRPRVIVEWISPEQMRVLINQGEGQDRRTGTQSQ